MRALRFLLTLSWCLAIPAIANGQPVMTCKTPGHPLLTQTGPEQQINVPVEGSPDVKRTLLKGGVRIICDDTQIYAEEIESFSNKPMVLARGDVLLVQPGLRISADHAEINKDTHLGTFFDASGVLQLGDRSAERNQFGSVEPDMTFWGDRVDKIADRTYRLSNGGFTTCEQPTPRWEMTTGQMTITLDKRAIIRNVVLKVKDVPLLYVPAIYYPINHGGRATGILMPQYGSSSTKGFTLGNAFFWAINRSQDLTLYHTLFKKTGQDVGSEYRFVSTSGNGNALFHMLAEHDQLSADGTQVIRPAHRAYTMHGNLSQGLPHGFRLFASVNYFTDAETQQRYEQNIFDLTNRNRYVGGNFSGGYKRYRFETAVEQTDTYYGLTSATRAGRLPVFRFNMADAPIRRSRVYFGARTEAGYFLKQEDLLNPATDHSMFRVDGAPTINMPLGTLPYLSARATASWRFSYWSKSRNPLTGAQVSTPISRQILDLNADVTGPTFSRIFQTPANGYAERFKHIIEPTLRLQWISPFDRGNDIWQLGLDGTESVVAGVTSISYGLRSRLFAKRRTAGNPSVVRDILDFDLGQTRYTKACAANFDPQYQTSFTNGYCPEKATNPYSPLAFSARAHPIDRLTAQFFMEIDSKYRAIRRMSANAGFTGTFVNVSGGWTKTQTIPGLSGFDNPAFAQHAFNVTTTLRDRNNHVGGNFGMNYDVHRRTLQNYRFVAYYNTQCCGVSVDYQSVQFAQFPQDHRLGFSFTLAGLGSFSNPMGSFGGGGR